VTSAEITAEGIWLTDPPNEPVMVHFDGRYLWSFTPARDGARQGRVLVSWPGNLVRFLDGVTRLRLQSVDGETVWFDAEHRFGTSTDRVAVVNRAGEPLSVDKVGHLGRAFLETPDEIKREILVATQEVLTVLREETGVDAYLCYGALLGAVRNGKMIGHDSDVDLCFYSHKTTPVDIIRESYRVERIVRTKGWTVTRMSGGDIKVVRVLSGERKCHIDIFGAFTIPGGHGEGGRTFYQFGNRSGSFDAEADLLPLGTVTLEGLEFPAPKNPEAMLAFVYGPHWKVPDPSFVHRDNPIGVVRLNGWFRGFRDDLPAWNDVYDQRAGDVPRAASDFARWVAEQIGPEDKIADLGAGTGRDTRYFAKTGHAVRAIDFSRRSFARTRRIAGEVRADQTMFNELRRVLVLGARLARNPRHLYARHLIGCLDAEARTNLYRLASVALRGGQAMFLEFQATAPGAPVPQPVGLVRRLDADLIAAEITAAGGRIDYRETVVGADMFDDPDPAVCRMRVTWPAPKKESK